MKTDYNTKGYDLLFRRGLFILFCITGIISMIYLLILIRFFQTLFGVGLNANFLILSTFILGIAVGGYIGGRYIDIKRNELKTFIYLEFITIFLIFVLYLLFTNVIACYKHVFQLLYEHNALIYFINFFISFITLLPLTAFMGARFSVLGRYLIRSENLVAKEIGTLQGSFVLGTAIGCLLSYLLIIVLGINLTFFIVLFINLLITVITRLLLFKFSSPQNVVAEFYDQRLKHFADYDKHFKPGLINFVLIGALVTSLIAGAYTVLLLRNIFYFSGTNLFIQSIILASVLISYTLGNYISTKFISEHRNLLFKFAFFQLLIGIVILISLIYLPKIITFNQKLWLQQYQYESYFSYLDTILLIVMTFILIGLIFPVMFKIYLTKFEQIGKRIGNFYAAYFIGVALGLVITSRILEPLIGVTNAIITIAGCNFVMALVIALKTSRLSAKYKIILSSILFLIIISFFLFFPNFYDISPGKDEKIVAQKGTNVIYSVNNNICNNELFLKVNGLTLAGNSFPYRMSNNLTANLPLLLNGNPKNVFINGFGNGQIPGMVTDYQIESIDCSETSSEVVELSDYFAPANHKVVNDPKLNLIPIDGITYLNLTNNNYDVIINNYIQSEFFNNYLYYTKEYFKNCRNCLNAGGIIAVNVPLINFSFEKFQVLLNTFHSVFPFTSIWYNNNNINYNLLLVGSTEDTFSIDFNKMYHKIQSESIKKSLTEIGLNSVYEVLDCYICGPNSLNQVTNNLIENSFNYPYWDFTKETKADREIDFYQYLQLFKNIKEPVIYLLDNLQTPKEDEDVITLVLNTYYKSSSFIFDGFIFEMNNRPESALQTYRLGFQINKLDFGAKRFIDSYYDPQLMSEPKTPVEFTENAKIYYQKMEYQKSIELFNEALKLDRKYAPAYFGLGINYELLNDSRMAKKMYRRTLRLKPKLKPARERLDNLIKKEKEFEDSFKRGLFNK